MTLTLELPPKVETGLSAQAQERGVPLRAYVEALLRQQAGAPAAASGQMRRELRWLRENRVRYAGRWVALRGGELLATGDNAAEVFAAVRDERDTPLVVKVEAPAGEGHARSLFCYTARLLRRERGWPETGKQRGGAGSLR